MLKKFLIGTFAVAALAFAMSASAAYDFGTTTLKVGSRGEAVKAVQTVVGATPVDGVFGPMTAAKVKAWQASNGLTADGVFGAMSKAKANETVSTGGTYPAGCTSTVGYSSTTGAKCDGTTTGGTDNGPLVGGAGDMSLTSTTSDVETEVVEGKTEKVLGFKVEALDSDIALKNLKVILENTNLTGSYRLNRYADKVEVYMGSTLVGTASVSDFTKKLSSDSECASNSCYVKSISLDNAVVRSGSNHKATFYVKVSALSNIDSTDVNNNSWKATVDNIRFQDATGVVSTSTDTANHTFAFTDLAGQGDLKLTISKGSSSPVAQDVTVSDTSSTSDVLMLEFKLKATGSDMTFDTLSVAANGVVAGGTTYLGDMVSELTLKNGSDTLATVSDFAAADTDTAVFDLDNTFTIDQDSTETFRVYAKINDIDLFHTGDSLTVNFTNTGIAAEDSNGDTVTSETGSATGSTQTFVFGTPTLAKVSASLPATPTTHTDGTATGEEDLYTATLKFTVTAPDDTTVYVPLDSFAYGTAGTAGVQYTVTGGATVVSANVQYSGSDDLSSITETHSYRIDAGTTQQFTLSVVLKGNDAYGKVTMTGFDYETAEGTPDNTPTATISSFYTSSVLLAK